MYITQDYFNNHPDLYVFLRGTCESIDSQLELIESQWTRQLGGWNTPIKYELAIGAIEYRIHQIKSNVEAFPVVTLENQNMISALYRAKKVYENLPRYVSASSNPHFKSAFQLASYIEPLIAAQRCLAKLEDFATIEYFPESIRYILSSFRPIMNPSKMVQAMEYIRPSLELIKDRHPLFHKGWIHFQEKWAEWRLIERREAAPPVPAVLFAQRIPISPYRSIYDLIATGSSSEMEASLLQITERSQMSYFSRKLIFDALSVRLVEVEQQLCPGNVRLEQVIKACKIAIESSLPRPVNKKPDFASLIQELLRIADPSLRQQKMKVLSIEAEKIDTEREYGQTLKFAINVFKISFQSQKLSSSMKYWFGFQLQRLSLACNTCYNSNYALNSWIDTFKPVPKRTFAPSVSLLVLEDSQLAPQEAGVISQRDPLLTWPKEFLPPLPSCAQLRPQEPIAPVPFYPIKKVALAPDFEDCYGDDEEISIQDRPPSSTPDPLSRTPPLYDEPPLKRRRPNDDPL